MPMRGKLWFLGGMAAGFILGARAGREKYEELVRTTQKIKESPTVQDATDVVREQATKLYSEGRNKLASSRLADTKFGRRLATPTEADSDSDFGLTERPMDDTLTTPTSVGSSSTSNAAGTRGSDL